jgi:hypothetical protein
MSVAWVRPTGTESARFSFGSTENCLIDSCGIQFIRWDDCFLAYGFTS